MTETPNSIHPRRLFCSASPGEIDSTSCLKPSVIAHQERARSVAPLLLAPSPKSPAVLRTHVEIGALESDVELLVEVIKNLERKIKNPQCVESITLTSQETLARIYQSAYMRDLIVPQLQPLRQAIEKLESEFVETNHSKNISVMGIQTEDPFVETPKNKEMSRSSMTDSRMLSADLAHLRTIQKEVRGLFNDKPETVSSMSSSEDPQTATKISRMLASQIGGFSQLTLSPTTEIFEKVKTNPWFKDSRRRSGSLPNVLQDEVVITDSPISTIAPVSAAFTNREILANDESLTVSALHAAMARRRAPSVGSHARKAGTSDLVNRLRKQDPDNKKRMNNVYRNFPDSSIYRN